jgi:asparagine synthase (glutamine-hydrolysing)
MAVSLEARVPFLDHRVAEFAWSVPLHMKVRAGRGKWLSRQVLARYLAPALTDHPKQGFSIPLHDWLRGPLREWAETLLSEKSLTEGGYIRAEPVREAWSRLLSGDTNQRDRIWAVLMFQSWLERWPAQGRPQLNRVA